METHETDRQTERAILAGVHTGALDPLTDTTPESMEELEQLAETAGAETVGTMVQNRPAIENATYFGEGKLEELKAACLALDADLVVTDSELSPVQIRNLERILDVRVIDRTALILDIFARRAASREGKLQVELAQLSYLLPRLAGMGTQLSRLGGGIGTRGPGETKLETDRRHIRRKITHLRAELAEVKKHRTLIRSRRRKDNRYVAALVGYTNAGKSTLLNALTGAGVLAEDKLFATLDPTIRALTLPDGREIMLSDTVGFIRKLPHHLVDAFRSTLEEAAEADMLLIVADSTSPEVLEHLRVVRSILADIGAGAQPAVCVFNKIDARGPDSVRLPALPDDMERAVEVSARTGEGLDALLSAISEIMPGKKQQVELLIPYSEGGLTARLHQEETILEETFEPEGTRLRVLLGAEAYARYRAYRSEGGKRHAHRAEI